MIKEYIGNMEYEYLFSSGTKITLTEQEIEELESTKFDLQNNIDVLGEKCGGLEWEITDLEHEVSVLEDEIQILNTKNDELNKIINDSKC